MWGVRDLMTKDEYGPNVLGVRQVVPRLLDMFERRSIRCTWATVGFLFFDNKDELLASLPLQLPTYDDPARSNYSYMHEVGSNERQDPYYFGKSLLEAVKSCPGQEIGTHTFSHYYCLEPGQTNQQFNADIEAAVAAAKRLGVTLKSIVFPRNQFNDAKIGICARHGLRVFRGNEQAWYYRSLDRSKKQSPVRRAIRLADSYLTLSGANAQACLAGPAGTRNVPSSRYLRRHIPKLAPLDNQRLARITSAMRAASTAGTNFHIWWHPHDFGLDTNENLRFLSLILDEFERLRDENGMTSRAMGDFDA